MDGMSCLSTAFAFKVLALVVSLHFGEARPYIAWHGIYDADGSASDRPVSLTVSVLNVTGTASGAGQAQGQGQAQAQRHHIGSCGGPYTAIHLFAVGGMRIVAAGCGHTCFDLFCDSPDDVFFGGVWVSEDAGLHWSAPNATEYNHTHLLRAGASAVTIPPSQEGAPTVHCLLGGFDVLLKGEAGQLLHASAATGLVTCSTDGVTWTPQAVSLPSPRAAATPMVWRLPHEQHYRLFLFSGISVHIAGDARLPVSAAHWLLMSNPLVLTADTQPDAFLTEWTHVQEYPDELQDRVLPLVLRWPGCMHRPSSCSTVAPGQEATGRPETLVIGLGYDVGTHNRGEYATDLLWTADPTNSSAWGRLLVSSATYDGKLEGMGSAWPSVKLDGWGPNRTTLGTFGADEPKKATLVFTDDHRVYLVSPYWQGLSPVVSTVMSTSNREDAVGEIVMPLAPALPTITSVVDVRGPGEQVIVVALFENSIMRAFIEDCDHTCPTGSYALHCGTHPGDVTCAPCTSCTGALGVDPVLGSPTTIVDPGSQYSYCRTGPARNSNENTRCKACTAGCIAPDLLLRTCLPESDTVCGPRPQFLPSAARVQATHGMGTTIILSTSAALCIVCAVSFVCTAVVGSAQRARRGGAALQWVTSSSGGGQGADKAAVIDSPLSTSRALEYEQSLAASAHRSAIRAALKHALWACTLGLDFSLSLLCHWSVLSLCWAVLWPDPVPDAVLLPEDYSAPLTRNAQAVLAVTVVAVLCNSLVYAWSRLLQQLLLHHQPRGVAQLLLLPLLPLHSRLGASFLSFKDGNRATPLPSASPPPPVPHSRGPAGTRLRALLALWSPASLLLYNLPCLGLLSSLLSASGFSVSAVLSGEAASVPVIARAALLCLLLDTLWSAARLAWDVLSCTRSGGLYRLRRAVLSMPELLWLVALVVPQASTRLPEGGEVVVMGVGLGVGQTSKSGPDNHVPHEGGESTVA